MVDYPIILTVPRGQTVPSGPCTVDCPFVHVVVGRPGHTGWCQDAFPLETK